VRAQAQQTVGIVGGVDLVPQAQIGQVIDVDAVSEGNRNGILPQFDPQDDLPETELADFLGQMVVPNQHPVGGRVGIGASSYQGHEVTPKKHLNLADPTPEHPLDAQVVLGVEVVNAKAAGGPDREASAVLVESDGEKLAARGGMAMGLKRVVGKISVGLVGGREIAALVGVLKLAIVHTDGYVLDDVLMR